MGSFFSRLQLNGKMRLNLVDHKYPEFVESWEIALKIGLNFNSSLWSGGGKLAVALQYSLAMSGILTNATIFKDPERRIYFHFDSQKM